VESALTEAAADGLAGLAGAPFRFRLQRPERPIGRPRSRAPLRGLKEAPFAAGSRMECGNFRAAGGRIVRMMRHGAGGLPTAELALYVRPMHDLKDIRDNPEGFDAGLKRRGLAPPAAGILVLDGRARALTTRLQELQARRNAASKAIGAAKQKKDEAEAARLMAEVEAIKGEMPALEADEAALRKQLDDILAAIPNLPAADVPDGKDETENVEVRKWGEPKRLNNAKEHFDIGEAMGLMDFETAAKMSGARFVLLKGALARLERAIANLMLDTHTGEFGYQECAPPLMVRGEAAYGTGQLPKFADDLFYTSSIEVLQEIAAEAIQRKADAHSTDFKNELIVGVQLSGRWLIPTAELSLTNIVADKIIDAEKLPLRFTAWTPCFRSEAGAAGKDTRGMIRMHQFSKVELVSVTAPEKSNEEHERMTACAETILKKLELPFRTVALCAGDMGFAARKTYDIEVWLPGQNRYREISSCSNCGDFQARRMKARLRRRGEKGTEFVHTLNGSGLAVGRTLVAVLENYQQADGSAAIPAALEAYMGGLKSIGTGD
jgi:seryl-tRNA synthetase